MSAIVIYRSSQLIACRGKVTRILNGIKILLHLVVSMWVEHKSYLSCGLSYRTCINAMGSCLIEHGRLPTSFYDIEGEFLRDTKTSREFTNTFL